MRAVLLVFALLVVAPVPALAGAGRNRTLLCKQSCGATIAQCAEETGRLRKCKRLVIRSCRRDGLSVCVPPSTFMVAPTGSDAPGCGNPEAPCQTMQYVVDELVAPDTSGVIKVAAGTYGVVNGCPKGFAGNLAVVCVVNRQITLQGGFVPPNWDEPSGDPVDTVIDPQGAGRGVSVVRGGEFVPPTVLVMDGFTIQNGLAEGAATGALWETSAFGGGLYAQHSAITLRNVVFRNNEARGGTTSNVEGGRGAGGALAAYSGWTSVDAPAHLVNVAFEGNHARGGGGAEMGGYALGGAMFTHDIAVTGDGVVFQGNTATGGPTVGAGTNGVEKADALGGALAVEAHGVVELRNVQARGNVATGGQAPNGDAGGAFGGAVFVEDASLALVDARLEDNRAQGGDGLNPTWGGSIAQGGALQASMSTLMLDRAIVTGNAAQSGNGAVHGGVPHGGGIAIILGELEGSDRPFTIRNAVIADNEVTHGTGALAIGAGGGLFVHGAAGSIEHATIADNRLPDPNYVGGGIGVLPLPGFRAHLTIADSIFANHRSAGLVPQAYATSALWLAEETSADVTRVLFANNLHDSNAGIDDPYNLRPGAFAMSGIVTAPDAGFVSANDYRLAPGSSAMDQAVGSTVTVDVEGNDRPRGAAPDLGAYEGGS